MKIMDRVETLNYLKDKMNNNERIIVPRYNDGEYLLMNNTRKYVAKTYSGEISEQLKKSIKVKNQLVCINYLKPHNIEKKDTWYLSHNYLVNEGEHDLYGCSNYNTYDFSNDCSLLVKQFSGKVLLVTGLADQAFKFFSKNKPDMSFFKTPDENAAQNYEFIYDNLLNCCNKYETILFSCGPVSKVLIADLIDKCSCNLIDLGSVLNAILDLTNGWTMSWIKDINLKKQIKIFKDGITR